MVVASTEGGMSVEEISQEKPESIIRSKIEVAVGMQEFQSREIAFGLGDRAKTYIKDCKGNYQLLSNF